MDARQMYNKWLKDFADDQALVEELNAIAGDEKEIEDRFYRGLEFGTAGMRGVIGYGTNRMNVYNVRRATQGLAQFIHKVEGGAGRGVAIAYDSRRFSPEFALEAAKVHEVCGKDFVTVTPGVRFADGDIGDQVRVMTPAQAKEIGSDYIVVGRPITAAADPVAAYRRCVREFVG